MRRSPNAVRILVTRARSRLREFLCRNCEHLGGGRCRCVNMIEFSLEHDLIDRYRPTTDIPGIRRELRRFSDEVSLLRSLPRPEDAIADALASGRYSLFPGK
jgi:hypothetical protein